MAPRAANDEKRQVEKPIGALLEGVGAEVGAEVVGAAVGATVVGEEVAGAEVAGTDMAGAEVISAAVAFIVVEVASLGTKAQKMTSSLQTSHQYSDQQRLAGHRYDAPWSPVLPSSLHHNALRTALPLPCYPCVRLLAWIHGSGKAKYCHISS